MSYYKSNENHVYKRLNSGYVLHVNYSNALVNILSPAMWDDVIDPHGPGYAGLTQITKEQFEQKAKATLAVINNSLKE